MIRSVKCPVCKESNALPIYPHFADGRLKIDVKKCTKCGVHLTEKEYIELTKK